MRLLSHRHRGLQAFTRLTSGEAGRAAGNFGGRVKYQDFAASANECGESGLMQRLAHGYCSNLGTLLRQSGGGEQPIAAIVAGPGKQHDGSILERQILVIQHAGGNMGCGLCGHAHQRHALIQQRTFQIPHRAGVIGTMQ